MSICVNIGLSTKIQLICCKKIWSIDKTKFRYLFNLVYSTQKSLNSTNANGGKFINEKGYIFRD